MKQEKYLFMLSYFLVLIAYMTLTLSLPLVGSKLSNADIPINDFVHGLSILFFMFSLSAITLSRLADILGSYRVLSIAQPCSIAGLCLLGIAHHVWTLYLGFFIVGFGTGCYSSISRLLIAKYASNVARMRHGFATFSIIIMFSPIFSSHIMVWSMHFNWRYAYFIMALIEIFLFIGVIVVLRRLAFTPIPSSLKDILLGYGHCLGKILYRTNFFFVGIGIALIVTVILGNTHQLFVKALHQSTAVYNQINFLLIVAYIVGILVFRMLSKKIVFLYLRTPCVILFLGSCWLFSEAHSLVTIVTALALAAFALGNLVPMSTSEGMEVIQKDMGAAAALYTFAFAVVSGCWSLFQSVTTYSVRQYLAFGMNAGAIILLLLLIRLIVHQFLLSGKR